MVSAADGPGRRWLGWWRGASPRERRMALHRWFPHLPLAAGVALLGVLETTTAAERALGGGLPPGELGRLERQLNPLQHGPVLEFAVGVSLLSISIGIGMRSRLAWLWCMAALLLGLSVRIPPRVVDAPLLGYIGVLFVLLFAYRRHFVTRGVATSGVFAVVILATFFVWATLGTLRLGSSFDPPVLDLTTALYFSVVTVASVGFGDIVPVGPDARLFVTVMIAIGILVAATSVSAVLLPLIGGRMREALGGRAHVDRFNHYVIVGKSPLARNAALELEKRSQRVTLVLDGASEEDFYRTRDVVVGDPSDLTVLRSAGADHAKGVLALSTDDAENGFVVLGVNELDITIPTVAALNDPSNRHRLLRTQPSLLLSLQALGGELLAMALTGERVDVQMLTRVLQVHGTEPATGTDETQPSGGKA